MRTKQDYLSEIPFEFLIGFSKETGLIRDNACFTKKDFIHRLIPNLTLSDCQQLNEESKEGHCYKSSVSRYLNEFPTGNIVSKNFVEHLGKFESQLGSIFYEFPITHTRVDILRLSGEFYAYEVKSVRDKLDRLVYQIPALQKYFDYVTVVIPTENEKSVRCYLQKNIGITSFQVKDRLMVFDSKRKAKKSVLLDSIAQLEILRLDELRDIYRCGKLKPTRKEAIEGIMRNLNTKEIHTVFLSKLKDRERKTQTNHSNQKRLGHF